LRGGAMVLPVFVYKGTSLTVSNPVALQITTNAMNNLNQKTSKSKLSVINLGRKKLYVTSNMINLTLLDSIKVTKGKGGQRKAVNLLKVMKMKAMKAM